MRYTSALLSIALHAACCTAVTATVNGTTYLGFHRDKVEEFLGIQYAHNTGGSNRFKPPVPYVPRDLVINATTGGLACPQKTDPVSPLLYLQNITEVSEDCLRLNIARPNGTTSRSKLPVLVYIHGGSFVSSSKDEPITQPGGLILNSITNGHPIIHVAVNYRLGIFGFAKSEALRAEGSENAGLRDQRLAIEWVSQNIAAFGGDPSKITIHGQSSGGASMGWQILAYGGSKGAPFQQAIAQSQVIEAGVTGNLTRDAMSRVAGATGCNSTNLQSNSTIACLRDLSLEDLLQAQIATYKSDASANFGDEWLPSVDGDFFPAAPTELIATGRFSNISTIIGWCDDDADIIVASTPLQNDSDVHQMLVDAGLNSSNTAKLEDLYPTSDFRSTYFPNGTIQQPASFYRGSRLFRDIGFVCQPFLIGEALAKNGNNVYYYNQNQSILETILHARGYFGYGVVHTSELAYAFGNFSHYFMYGFEPDPTLSDIALQWAESRSWSSFVALGHPSVHGTLTLQGWEKGENATDFGVYTIGGPNSGYRW
ncbi:Secreted lipase [Pseudocercospora fuligena]|uniref:Carboxylic ester hydrolase n=1 Tax=Pseudocercospora fuligena TaxID=685502 RepID=A0A8H6VIE7_9PEZI|nr:Secreted lipase [Pseudocercospora fuligena]